MQQQIRAGRHRVLIEDLLEVSRIVAGKLWIEQRAIPLLPVVAAAFALVWVPEISTYWVLPRLVSLEVVQAARTSPPDDVLGRVQIGIRLRALLVRPVGGTHLDRPCIGHAGVHHLDPPGSMVVPTRMGVTIFLYSPGEPRP